MTKKHSKSIADQNSMVNAADLKQAIDRCLFATSDEKRRYLLNVVRFFSDGAILRLESTDGCRASLVEIEVAIPTFEILISIPDCKAIKKLCARKGDTIAVSLTSRRRTLTFKSSGGESVTVGNAEVANDGIFPPLDHVFSSECKGTIPVLDPEAFRRGVSKALEARHGGQRVSKFDPHLNVIHITSTCRRTMIYGRRHRFPSITYLSSDERATAVSVKVNGAFLLELLKHIPDSDPYELYQWKGWTKGVAFISPTFKHFLCGVRIKRGWMNYA